MERYTVEQRILIVKNYYQNGEIYIATIRKVRPIFGRNFPNSSTVKRIIEKFESTGSVNDVKHTTEQNINAVRESVAERPQTSVRHRAQELDISATTVQRILTKDLHLHPYKVQLTQQLLPTDHAQRREFTNWILEQHADFEDKIVFSDETHFHLDGFVNRHNCRIWGSENPRMIHEKAMHPKRVTGWCALWSGGIIGPFFFEDEEGNAVTVNGERYRAMITQFLVPQLEDIALDEMWFQQGGATCHTARETLMVLHEFAPGRVISRFGDQNWPPRSCDLTPLDFWL